MNELIYNFNPFGFKNFIIENLYYHSRFEQVWFGIDTYLTRLPFVPLFITGLSKVSLNAYYIIINKNIIFFSLIFYCIKILSKNFSKKFLSFIILMIIFFFIIFIILLFYQHIYMLMLILHQFYHAYFELLSVLEKFILISILIFILYFTKTSVFYLTIFISILFFYFRKKFKYL